MPLTLCNEATTFPKQQQQQQQQRRRQYQTHMLPMSLNGSDARWMMQATTEDLASQSCQMSFSAAIQFLTISNNNNNDDDDDDDDDDDNNKSTPRMQISVTAEPEDFQTLMQVVVAW